MVALLLHGGNELLVLKLQQGVQVHVQGLPLLVHQGHRQLGGHVASAAGHAQQAAVQDVRPVLRRGQGVGGAEPQIIVAVEAHRDLDAGLQSLHICSGIGGVHGAGGVHNGDLVHPVFLQTGGLLGQFLWGEQVSLHQGIAHLDAVLLDDGGLVIGRFSVSRVRTQTQEGDALVRSHSHVVCLKALGVQKHADFRPVQIGVDQVQVGRVADGGGRTLLCGAQALGVAHLNNADVAAQQPLDHHSGQLRGEAVAYHIGPVPQGTVHDFHCDFPP